MKRGKVQYQSYADAYRVNLAGARRDLLDEAALTAEGYAKTNMVANDTVDTGFALNTIHAILSGGEGLAPSAEAAINQEGRQVQRASEGLPAMDDHTSAVGCGADYALYIEVRAPFLYPALEQVKQDFGGMVATVKRERGL